MLKLVKTAVDGCSRDQQFLRRQVGDRFTAHWSPAVLARNVNLRAGAWMRIAAQGGPAGMVAREMLIKAYGCDVTPGVVFEGAFHLPHPVGIVIGEGAVIGDGVTIYQNVTIGANRKGQYPRLGRDVTIYPSSVVVGNIEVGEGSVIGAELFVGRSVPAGTTVTESLR
ncbi:serine O-acetyltransferase [Luteococcus sp. Sow4_B9]|uniref:serine O-acetyltransferase n=1 Tax=Luteococcus sp. Sow4_B9 TaxID=3438792 RepID=UPI003F9A4A59